MKKEIKDYNAKVQEKEAKNICNALVKEIDAGLPTAESKVWHGHPVWFLDGNPVVGYAKRKDNVTLLFWSGQSFDEEELEKEGSFKAAQVKYTDVSDIQPTALRRWLKKAKTIQWDYKNIIKRKGRLVRLK